MPIDTKALRKYFDSDKRKAFTAAAREGTLDLSEAIKEFNKRLERKDNA